MRGPYEALRPLVAGCLEIVRRGYQRIALRVSPWPLYLSRCLITLHLLIVVNEACVFGVTFRPSPDSWQVRAQSFCNLLDLDESGRSP